jgi:hypothetical protein
VAQGVLLSTPERTDDGRYIVVGGRRWRASDPSIPPLLRQQLVDELMAARRAVRDEHGAPAVRARVQDAKVALGERGEPWWDDPSDEGSAERMAATIRALLRHRAPTSSICPSDVARVVGGPQWRSRLDDAREVAKRLRREGLVRITQGGKDVDPDSVRGPLRIARGPKWPETS